MECDSVRQLMMEAMDGDAGPELTRHVAACDPCDREMRALRAVDALLRAQALVQPPDHFPSRVMSYIDRRERAMPRWQVGLMRVGAIATGTALVGVAAAALLHGWRVVVVTMMPFGEARAWMDGVGVAARILADSAPSALATGLLAGLLAAVMALAWFGALVVPRHAPAGVSGRARRR